MFFNLKQKRNKQFLASLDPIVTQIHNFSAHFSNISDQDLKDWTSSLRNRIKNDNYTLDDILPEAFALVKEAAKRTVEMQHFNEQLKAGIAMHKGYIVEMKTGEGKTLAATLPAYLNALTGKVHVATVNDYLAKRDANEMSKIYSFLGLTCEAVLETSSEIDKKRIYACDIVYGTGSQFGFDFLRDNQKYDVETLCMKQLDFVIIDEIDRLLDDGSTPLILSEPSFGKVDEKVFKIANELVSSLKESHVVCDKKNHTIYFSNEGIEFANNFLRKKGYIAYDEVLYLRKHQKLVHCVAQSLKAYNFFHKNHEYIVEDKKIHLIDQMTGRVLIGRAYSNGLQQALQAKEKLEIEQESMTSGSISYQKYYSLYKKITGMSGTCFEESEEFNYLLGCKVVQIPTHLPIKREDLPDRIYNTLEEKATAIIKEIKAANAKKQPVLLITNSIESSDYFAKKLSSQKLNYFFLNAMNVQEEAEIIANAGKPGAIVIATNMAGRGTDVQLGGNFQIEVEKMQNQLKRSLSNEEKKELKERIKKDKEIVLAAGGLFVIGAERNENSRVDLQARGRSGRQGDIGKSLFFLSFDDTLIRRFIAVDNLRNMGKIFGIFKENEQIDDSFVRKHMINFQKEAEAQENDSRKNFGKFENIEDLQRKVFYSFRKEVLKSEDVQKKLLDIISQNNVNAAELNIDLIDFSKYRIAFLDILDQLWKDYLKKSEDVKEGIYLIASSGKDIYIEYQKKLNELFKNLLFEFNSQAYKKLYL